MYHVWTAKFVLIGECRHILLILQSNSFLHNISCSMKTDLPVKQLRSDFITVYHLAGSIILNSEVPPTIYVAMAPYNLNMNLLSEMKQQKKVHCHTAHYLYNFWKVLSTLEAGLAEN